MSFEYDKSYDVKWNEKWDKDGTYKFDYVDAINGHITQWYLGDKLPTSTLVTYVDNNGMISLLNVANDTAVTLVFNVINTSGSVLGRVYYQLMIQNNLKISINPALNANSVVDLYLGSEIYDHVGNTTVVDLLQSQEGLGVDAKYNNLFITLEQYSTGNTIAKGKALYNGDTNPDLGTGSQLSKSVVSDYLRFSIGEPYGDVDGKVEVKVDSVSAKLIISGNPSGSFRLNVSAANETGYGRSFVINVNKYDHTEAQFSDEINDKNGSGRASGETIDLFKDIGQQGTEESKQQGDFAFTSYRSAYGRESIKDLSILDSDATVTYQVKTFAYGTSVSAIKSSDWSEATEKTIKIETVTDPETEIYADGGILKVGLPSVKTSTSTESTQYQIVSYKLTVSYNNDTTNCYYAHYLVYNADQIKVNMSYSGETTETNRGKVITYGQDAWSSDGDGKTITLMDTNNKGLYASTTLVRSAGAPADWASKYNKYYVYNEESGIYSANTDTTYAPNKFYKLNDVAKYPDKYEFVIPEYNNGAGYRCDLAQDGVGKITATLPDNLFKNKADITIIIRAIEGGGNVVEDKWTIQAGTTITPYDSKPLSMFFLLSEIGQDLYQNCEIIGIGTDYNNFVTGGTKYSIKTISLVNGYTLEEVLYIGTDGNDVFDVEQYYYVLVGHSTAMSFTFNAGADYFINLTIDDNALKDTQGEITTNAKINLENFVTIWSYTGNKFNYSIPTGLSLDESDDYVEFDNDIITLSNVNKITESKFVDVTIKYNNDIRRSIKLYFNIVINARTKNDKGESIFNDGVLKYNEAIASAMDKQTDNILTNDEISTNLKKELLSLINFNDSPVVVDGVVDSVTLSRYSIKVSGVGTYYEITYTYTGATATYVRTLKMAKS
jgi:hypothetical protein